MTVRTTNLNLLCKTFRLVSLALVSSFLGCNAFADIWPGNALDADGCITLADCTVAEPACRTAVACTDNLCIFEHAIEGKPLPMQVSGDCMQTQCDGKGGTKQIPLPDDADDGNPCTLDACDGFAPTHTLQNGFSCYTGPLGTQNQGLCKAGFQACDATGKPVGICEGQVVPRLETCYTPQDDDCDGLANEEGDGCACTPGFALPCYSGPDGTDGIGICRHGFMTCSADGIAYGPCEGEVVPGVEHCDPGFVDEDCDGEVNEDGLDCTCGDNVVSHGEMCDDGNIDAADACNPLCQISTCGDGFVASLLGEECDDQNLDPTDRCLPNCKNAPCGDGIHQFEESCDDGNVQDGDGCPSTCFFPVVDVAAGHEHTCAVLIDGRVKCWGDNRYGQLGLGDIQRRGATPETRPGYVPAVDLGTDKHAIAVAAGFEHSCALLLDGNVKCWGRNDSGQLGLGDTLHRGDEPDEMGDALAVVNLGTDKTAVAIAAGYGHTCALLNDGTVKCWGGNYYGLLGLGDEVWRGGNPTDMGDNLPAVDIDGSKKVVAISTRMYHVCALIEDGSVKCWGYNENGALGLGDANHRGDQSGEMGANLPPVDLGTNEVATAIAAGWSYSCALLEGGRIKCWGENDYGQLGLGDTNHRGDVPGEMGNALPEVDLGTGTLATGFMAGESRTCAIVGGGDAKCWGRNLHGAAGLGTISSIGKGPNQMGNKLPTVDLGTSLPVSKLSSGIYHGCAIFQGGRLKCWGYNFRGTLGLGDMDNRGDAYKELGDKLWFVAP